MGGVRGGAQPPRRSKDLRGTTRRLFGRLRPERVKLALALVLGVTSVAFMVSGPQILGSATNVLFNGIVGKRLAPGTTKAQAIHLLRAHGGNQIATMISGMKITPGVGVNIDELGRVLGLCALDYLAGAAFNYFQGFTMAGVTQRVMSGLRRDVEEKLSRVRAGRNLVFRHAQDVFDVVSVYRGPTGGHADHVSGSRCSSQEQQKGRLHAGRTVVFAITRRLRR